MAPKDYFQDITPPAPGAAIPRPAPPPPAPPSEVPAPESGEKSIRNIQITPMRRTRMGEDAPHPGPVLPPPPPRPPKHGLRRFALWGGVLLALLALASIVLVALRPTTITIVPRSHTIIFDESSRFTAYPSATAATGTLAYSIETQTFEDSELVTAQGVENVEEKAGGTITVYNDYSTSPQRLIRNTRFETPEGLVFRTPSEIVVPGKTGTTPGQVSVTVIADQAGERYNIGPVERFTLPGLENNASMFSSIYARSTTAIGGGFVGERPTATPSELEAARAQIRSRLQEKILSFAQERTNVENFAFADLARITFEAVAPIGESEGQVRVGERARVEIPVFPADSFAHIVGERVSAGAPEGDIVLKPLEGFAARAEGSEEEVVLGSSPVSFALTGSAQLVWLIDSEELTAALAGRDESAFQTIVSGFPGVEEARARIEPFWSNTFPENASSISVRIEEPRSSF